MDIGTIVKIFWYAVAIFVAICIIQTIINTMIEEHIVKKARRELIKMTINQKKEDKKTKEE